MQQITLYQYTTGVKHINLFTDEMSSDLHIFGFERSIRPNVPVVPVLKMLFGALLWESEGVNLHLFMIIKNCSKHT